MSQANAGSVEVLLFDVFGTVVDWRTSLQKWFQRFGQEHNLKADWIELVDDWRAAYQPSLARVRNGQRPYVTLDTLHRESLDTLLERHGLSGIPESHRQQIARAWRWLDPWPDTVAGLTRLKRKFVIGTLSNGGVGLLTDLAKFSATPWDVVLSADLFRHYKPDAAVYQEAAELMARPPSALMLVAAHNYDLEAARSHGYRTAFVARPAEYGPRKTSDTAAPGQWDYVVTSLEELAERMGA
ncbi:MAG: haloacid dehalogenase type II [Terriglobales bacterium]